MLVVRERESCIELALSLSEGGQRGEVVSGEGDEQWLLKGSQGWASTIWLPAGLACLGEVSYEQVRYGQSVVWPDSEELCCCCFCFLFFFFK